VNTGWNEIARLFEYPGPDYYDRIRECRQQFSDVEIQEFATQVEALSPAELEETYTRVFDLNPDATLDIGWHLFGEDYARGEFLVHLRQKAREYGVPETTELPDHLTRVLPLLARMPEEEAAEFVSKFILPALAKIAKTLAGSASPYSKLIAALQQMLEPISAPSRPRLGNSTSEPHASVGGMPDSALETKPYEEVAG
jgi:nitrate reductase molybdenum cofactor assembly chaperone